ncbi:MAG: AI-2E family transporter [Pseudomonadota bacterium]
MSGTGEERPEPPRAAAELSLGEKWSLVGAAVLFGALLYLLAPILTPFVIAALLAYMGDPLVDRLEAKKLSRTLGVTLIFFLLSLVLLVVLLVVVPMLEQQVSALIARLPQYLEFVQQRALPWVAAQLGLDPGLLDLAHLKALLTERWSQVGDIAGQVLGSVFHSGVAMMAWLANLVLIPVVAFYLMRDWDVFMTRVRELIPRRWEPEVVMLAGSADEVLGAFFRGQLLVMLALGVLYTVGLWIIGLEFALLLGMIAGLVSFVPYLGFIVGMLLAGVAAYMQFQELMPLLGVLAVFGVGQLAESLVLTPKLVGDRIGLHPVAVIFAVMAGGQLFGLIGVLCALPVAAVIMVILRHTHERYLRSRLYAQ